MSAVKFDKNSDEWKMFEDFSAILKIVQKYDNSELKPIFQGLVNATFADCPKTKEHLVDYWKLVQQFWNIEKNSEYWNNLLTASGNLSTKYNDDEFITKLISAFFEQQERRNKK